MNKSSNIVPPATGSAMISKNTTADQKEKLSDKFKFVASVAVATAYFMETHMVDEKDYKDGNFLYIPHAATEGDQKYTMFFLFVTDDKYVRKRVEKLVNKKLEWHVYEFTEDDRTFIEDETPMTSMDPLFGFDENRVLLFEKLFHALNTNFYAQHPYRYGEESYRNIAFFESYFSNYLEGELFGVTNAKMCIDTSTPFPNIPNDTHDILGTYRVVYDREEMNIVPKDVNEFIDILSIRHKILLSNRPAASPGKFKDVNNHNSKREFVDYKLMLGTLRKGFEFYAQLKQPFAKAAFMLFLVTEVHPFIDANGRLARAMMNAELSSRGQCKIIIPTNRISAHNRALISFSDTGDPASFIRSLNTCHDIGHQLSIAGDFVQMKDFLELSGCFNQILRSHSAIDN